MIGRLEWQDDSYRLGRLCRFAMEFKRIVFGVLIWVLMMLLGLAISGRVDPLTQIVSESCPEARTNAFDIAHIITEFESRLPVA